MMVGPEHSEQGYNASYVYCDSDMMYIARSQMELVKGELPTQANEVAVSEYFLSAYGSNAKIGETVRLDTESFHGDYTVTGILSNVGEKEANLCAIAVSKAALTQWAGFDPAGYRAYVHFKNDRQFDQETMAAGNPLNEEMRQDILFADGVADVRFWLPGWCAGRKNSPWLSR